MSEFLYRDKFVVNFLPKRRKKIALVTFINLYVNVQSVIVNVNHLVLNLLGRRI